MAKRAGKEKEMAQLRADLSPKERTLAAASFQPLREIMAWILHETPPQSQQAQFGCAYPKDFIKGVARQFDLDDQMLEQALTICETEIQEGQTGGHD